MVRNKRRKLINDIREEKVLKSLKIKEWGTGLVRWDCCHFSKTVGCTMIKWLRRLFSLDLNKRKAPEGWRVGNWNNNSIISKVN